MTREECLSMLADYGRYVPYVSGAAERFPADGSERKANRWMSWAQGVAEALGYYTREEIKQHSRTRTVTPPSGRGRLLRMRDDIDNDISDARAESGMWADGARSALIAARERIDSILRGDDAESDA